MRIQHLFIVILVLIVLIIWIGRNYKIEIRKKELKTVIDKPVINAISCQPPPMTGRLTVTTEDTPGDSNCGIRLGDIYDPIVGQSFSASWNDSRIHEGGYLMTWGATGLFYGLDKARMFEKNMTIVTQAQFESDGNGFAISRGGVIPCDCCGVKNMKTPISVTPIRNLRSLPVKSNHRDKNDIRVEFDLVPELDTYVVLTETKRKTTLPNIADIPNIAYHGIITTKGVVTITLPAYEWDDEINSGSYDDTTNVKIFGYKLCDVGNMVTTRVGNLALFAE
jgi:hypothetical protein